MESNPPLFDSGREKDTDHSSTVLRYPPHPYVEDAESKDIQYKSEPASFHGSSRMNVSSTDSFPGALPGQLLIEYPGPLPTEDLEEERPINPPNTPQTLSESSFSYGTPCRHTELEESLDSFDSEETESDSSTYENDAAFQNLSLAVDPLPHVPYIQRISTVSIESQFEPFQLETIEEEPVEGTTASGVNTMNEEPRLQKETPRSTSFTAILNEDEEEIDSDEDELSVQFIENIEDEPSLDSVPAENSTVASLDVKAAGEDHKSAEAEDKDVDEDEDEDMLFSVPMTRKPIPKGTALKLTISIPSGPEDSTRLPTSPKRDVYDPTSLRKPGPVKMESLEHGFATRRRGILPPPSLKLPPVSSIPQEPPPSYEESMGLTSDPGVLLKDPFDGTDSESDSDSDSDDDDDDDDDDAFDPNNEDDLYDTASSRLDVLDRLIAETKASRSFSLRKEPTSTTTEVGSDEYEEKHLRSQENQHLDATTTRPNHDKDGPLIFRKPPRKEYGENFRLEPHPRVSKTQHVGNLPLQPLSIGGSQAELYDLSVNKPISVPTPSNDTPSITEELPRHRSIRTFHGFLESRKPDQRPEDDMNKPSLKLSKNSRDNLSGPRMVFKRDLGSKDRKGYSDMINILQGVIDTLERPISTSEPEISTAVEKSQIIVDSNSTSQRTKTHLSSSNALCSSEMDSHIEEDRIEEDGEEAREKAQKELSEDESEGSDEPRSKGDDRPSTDDDQNSDHGPSSGGAETMTGHTTSDQDNQERSNSNTGLPPPENDGKTSFSSSNNSKMWGHHVLNCEYMLEPVSTHQALEGHQTKLLSIEKQGLYLPSATNKTLTQKPNLPSKTPKGKYDTIRCTSGISREAQNCTEKQKQKSTSQAVPCSTSAYTSPHKVSEYKGYPQKSEYVFPISYVHGILESEPKNCPIKAVGDEKQSSWATLPGLAPVSHVLFSCLSCGFLDYKERTTCLRCTSPINSNKITLKSHGRLGQCTVCGYIGYQRGSTCPGCHIQKAPQHCSMDTQQHGNKQLSGRWKPRKNWNCPHCAFHNFRQRTVCNSCGIPAVPPSAAQSGISQPAHGPKSPLWQPTKTTSSIPLSSIYSKLVYANHATQIRTPQDVLKGSYKRKGYDTNETSHSAVEFAPEKRDYFFNYLRTIENKRTSF